jgi:hypothetical protein
MWIMLGIIFAGIVISAILMIRSRRPRGMVLPTLGWIGGLLAMSSFFLMSWITLGPPGTVAKNAGWIASQGTILNTIKQLPGLDRWLSAVQVPHGEDILASLDLPVKESFLKYAETGRTINGCHYMGLIRRVKPIITLIIATGVLAALTGAVLGLLRLITSTRRFRPAQQIVASLSFFSFILLLPALTTFDSMGSLDDFKLRLLTILAQTRVATGAWLCLFGFLLVGISGIADLVPGLSHRQDAPLDLEISQEYS